MVMRRSKQFILLTFLLVAFVSLAVSRTTNAQTAQQKPALAGEAKDNDQLLNAVLSELRQLRLAIQQNNLNTLRVQFGLQRVRFQQERVDRFSKELTEVRMNLNEATSNRPRMLERLKEMEARLPSESDPTLH